MGIFFSSKKRKFAAQGHWKLVELLKPRLMLKFSGLTPGGETYAGIICLFFSFYQNLAWKVFGTIYLFFWHTMEPKNSFFMTSVFLRSFFHQNIRHICSKHWLYKEAISTRKEDMAIPLSNSRLHNQNKAPKWISGDTVIRTKKLLRYFSFNAKQQILGQT